MYSLVYSEDLPPPFFGQQVVTVVLAELRRFLPLLIRQVLRILPLET